MSASSKNHNRDDNPMKRTTLILLVTSLVLAAGMIMAGCVQSNGTDAQLSSSNGQPQAGDSGTLASTSAGTSGQTMNLSGENAGTGSQHQYRGSGFLSNATRISSAAAKLGVTEDVLRQALNSTSGGRSNMTTVAQQLGVTQQQLTDALGIPAGGFQGHGMNNATAMQQKP